MGIINTQTIVACGSSIDIYRIFDSNQVTICPYVLIDKDKIQLFNINISFDKYNQIIIESNPSILIPPIISIKLNNNTFISAPIINQNLTYYIKFSSELTCRYSNNETICFYYSTMINFFHIEYQYDEIRHGSLVLSNKLRYRFYIIFIIIIILIIIICFFAASMLCTSRYPFHHIPLLDIIIDKHMAKEEAAKRVGDPQQQDGQPVSAEHVTEKETYLGVDG